MDQTLPIDDTQTRDPDDARWRQVAERRPGDDFVYAVTTTGIYCKPGCASRLPKRQNVAFFDDGAGAEAAGFRPCKRCRPDNARIVDPRLAAVAEACRRIEAAETAPKWIIWNWRKSGELQLLPLRSPSTGKTTLYSLLTLQDTLILQLKWNVLCVF